MMKFYYKLLVYRPVLVLFTISVFSLSCIFTSFLAKEPPNFTDPTLGFEARGTDISNRLTTWKNLLEETRPSGSLVVNPKEFQQHEFNRKHKKNKNRHQWKKLNKSLDQKIKILKDATRGKSFNVEFSLNLDDTNETQINSTHWEYGTNKSYDEETDRRNKESKKKKWKEFTKLEPPPITSTDFQSDGYFCESPSKYLSYTNMLILN